MSSAKAVSADPLVGDLRRAGLLPLLTDGALIVNPNTMYTPAGEVERARLATELEPRLRRIARSLRAIRREVL